MSIFEKSGAAVPDYCEVSLVSDKTTSCQDMSYWSNLSSHCNARLDVSAETTKNQQTARFHLMLVKCWASVTNGGPTLNQLLAGTMKNFIIVNY